MHTTKRLVLLALMVSQAVVLSIVESWIPVPVGVPGVKLGLANIITLIIIVFLSYKDALAVVMVRSVLTFIFAGGFVVFLFSITGGILSTIVMAVLYKRAGRFFSIIGISIAGAVMHNLGQLSVASFVMRELSIMTYLPVLLLSGVIMGCFVGLCSNFLIMSLKKTGIFT